MSSFSTIHGYNTAQAPIPSQRFRREERIARILACINEARLREEEGSLSDDSSTSESEDDLGLFELEWGEEEEAALRAIEEKYAEEKRQRSDEVQEQDVSGEGSSEVYGEGKETEPLGRTSFDGSWKVKREVSRDDVFGAMGQQLSSEDLKPAGGMAGPSLLLADKIRRAREMEASAHVRAAKEQQERERQAWMAKELEIRVQRSQKKAQEREERAERRREVIQPSMRQEGGGGAWLPPYPLISKQKRRKRARKERKRAEREEISRLRGCERELLELRASQAHGVPEPRAELLAPRQAVRLAGMVNRIEVLRRAKQEQERRQDEEGHQIRLEPDSDCPTASSSTVVKEEPQTPRSSQVLHQADDEDKTAGQESYDAVAECVTVQRTENENGEFRFEFVVDLKRFGKRRRHERDLDSQAGDPPDLEDDTAPAITKMAISVESATEYRVSLSGERPSKRVRDRGDTWDNGTEGRGRGTNGICY